MNPKYPASAWAAGLLALASLPAAAQQYPTGDRVTSGNAFNPQISVILDGVYFNDSVDGEGLELLNEAEGINHAHGHSSEDEHEHGSLDPGFNLRETEIVFSATVDAYFDAWVNAVIDGDGNTELEEAWFQTRSLPAGLKIKGGKFFSGIGYANEQHPHQWDFVDQNLPYLALLGDHGLNDTGVQITWLPDWGTYTLFGLEALQGNQEVVGAIIDDEEERAETNLGDVDDGPRTFTAFVKVAPDLGYSHALQFGASYVYASQQQEIHPDPVEHSLDGDMGLWGLDLVYKYDSPRSYGAGDFKLQSEYLYETKDLTVRYHETDPARVGEARNFAEDGFYVQGVYGIAPRWQFGLRYDTVGLGINEKSGDGIPTEDMDSSGRWTTALTWNPTEFSRLRLQFERANVATEEGDEQVDIFYLQYIMSMGSHGAHKF